MEVAIVTTANSLDDILEKLKHKDHKIGRKEMDSIFDNIVNGEGGRYFLDEQKQPSMNIL